MSTTYNILLILSVLIALFFILIVLVTGKGDAMSGGAGSVRTTFHGKASFEDYMSKLTFFLGGGFILMMIILNILATKMN